MSETRMFLNSIIGLTLLMTGCHQHCFAPKAPYWGTVRGPVYSPAPVGGCPPQIGTSPAPVYLSQGPLPSSSPPVYSSPPISSTPVPIPSAPVMRTPSIPVESYPPSPYPAQSYPAPGYSTPIYPGSGCSSCGPSALPTYPGSGYPGYPVYPGSSYPGTTYPGATGEIIDSPITTETTPNTFSPDSGTNSNSGSNSPFPSNNQTYDNTKTFPNNNDPGYSGPGFKRNDSPNLNTTPPRNTPDKLVPNFPDTPGSNIPSPRSDIPFNRSSPPPIGNGAKPLQNNQPFGSESGTTPFGPSTSIDNNKSNESLFQVGHHNPTSPRPTEQTDQPVAPFPANPKPFAPDAVAQSGTQSSSNPQGNVSPYDYDRITFRWLRGLVDYDTQDKSWYIIYSLAPSADDPFGGGITLVGDDRLNHLRNGQVVLVEGGIDYNKTDRNGRACFRVENLTPLQRKFQ